MYMSSTFRLRVSCAASEAHVFQSPPTTRETNNSRGKPVEEMWCIFWFPNFKKWKYFECKTIRTLIFATKSSNFEPPKTWIFVERFGWKIWIRLKKERCRNTSYFLQFLRHFFQQFASIANFNCSNDDQQNWKKEIHTIDYILIGNLSISM